jgi:AcrR family transcriptional regulator
VVTDRPLRADARRNRARVLAAAEEAFADRGTAVSTEEIAQAAGVGIGTVFRHFPTKEALLRAVFVARLERVAQEAEDGADAADPGQALFALITHAVDRSASKIALADALSAAGIPPDAALGAVGARVRAALEVLLARAREAGAVRPEVDVPALSAVLVGASRAVEHVAGDPALRQRVLALLLDGLRT